MSPLPTDRSPFDVLDTPVEHAADHNTRAAFVNVHPTDPAAHSGAISDAIAVEAAMRAVATPIRIVQPTPTMVTTFQTGHGFTGDGTGGTSNMNDTTQYVNGSQSASRVSNGAGGNAQITKTGITPTIDTTGKFWRLRVMFPDVTHLKTVAFLAGDTAFANYWRWDPVNVSTPPGDSEATFFSPSEWVTLTLNWHNATVGAGSPSRSNVTALRMTVTDDNTGNPVTFYWNELSLVPDPTPYPNGVVCFNFDDGYVSQWAEGRRQLSKYGYRGTCFIIGEGVDDVAGNFMTTTQLRRLQDELGWEIGSHAHTFAAHNNRLTSLSPGALDTELRAHRDYMTAQGFHARDLFAHPGGIYNPATLAAVRKYYGCARGTTVRIKETAPPGDQWRMRTRQLGSGILLAAVQAEVDAAYTNKSLYILTAHKFAATAADTITWDIASWNTLVDYVATKGIAVRTLGEVLRASYA